MDPKDIFSSKAEIYARYRWDYAPEAIQRIFDVAGLNAESSVADIGAGTGILTRHFAGRVRCVYLVEPNAAMANQAKRFLADHPGWDFIPSTAEHTTLPDGSIDLITAAHALDWFQGEAARTEFRRILKPGGWLVVLTNRINDPLLLQLMPALSVFHRKGINLHRIDHQPPEFYFGHENFLQFRFPFVFHQDWESFLGGIVSASSSPDAGEPDYLAMEQAAHTIFKRVAQYDMVNMSCETHLLIGHAA
jgi:SAM-dependent methyltransferase